MNIISRPRGHEAEGPDADGGTEELQASFCSAITNLARWVSLTELMKFGGQSCSVRKFQLAAISAGLSIYIYIAVGVGLDSSHLPALVKIELLRVESLKHAQRIPVASPQPTPAITALSDSSMAAQNPLVASSNLDACAAKGILGTDDELLASLGYKQGLLYASR